MSPKRAQDEHAEPTGGEFLKTMDAKVSHIEAEIARLGALDSLIQETTDDLKFTAEYVACIGACGRSHRPR